MDNKMQNFYLEKIEKLEADIESLYIIDRPDDYLDTRVDKVNVSKMLDEFTELERIYSSIEEGEPKGSIYEEYSKYLKNVRESKKVMEREVDRINKQEKAEITNANLLISAFKEELDNYE